MSVAASLWAGLRYGALRKREGLVAFRLEWTGRRLDVDYGDSIEAMWPSFITLICLAYVLVSGVFLDSIGWGVALVFVVSTFVASLAGQLWAGRTVE